jgi:hypothetical protein
MVVVVVVVVVFRPSTVRWARVLGWVGPPCIARGPPNSLVVLITPAAVRNRGASPGFGRYTRSVTQR